MPWVDGRTAVQGKIPLWNVEGTEASRVSPGMDAWVVLGPKGGASVFPTLDFSLMTLSRTDSHNF